MDLVTVFTASYNRRNTIERLYKSLQHQTSYEFEWIVLDDGSTDNTNLYFEEIIKEEKNFNIDYEYVENGGKHRAINKGIEKAKGKYFFIVDSDDYLINNCIEKILKWINNLPKNNENFVGVAGLKGYSETRMVGKTFTKEYCDSLALDREKNNIYGDKSEVYKTEILKKYKFPEIPGENFITEAVVWNRIANDGYLIRYFNEINYVCEYRNDGLTKKIDTLFCENFKGYTLFINELLSYKLPKKVKNRAIIAYGYRGREKKISYKKLASNIKISKFKLIISANLGKIYKKIIRNKKE